MAFHLKGLRVKEDVVNEIICVGADLLALLRQGAPYLVTRHWSLGRLALSVHTKELIPHRSPCCLPQYLRASFQLTQSCLPSVVARSGDLRVRVGI